MKLDLYGLSIEVTRRCNMSCRHCMRGPAQAVDLDVDKLRIFLKDVSYISSITFTGGEPTLNIQAIEDTLKIIKDYSIPVSSIYVVTNGKMVTSRFLNAMIDWYAYCIDVGGEPEICGIAWSQDEFHDKVDPQNIAKLRALSFFRPDDKKTRDWSRSSLINLGRARSITDIVKREAFQPHVGVEIINSAIEVDETIGFTVNGDVLADCDYEYASTDSIKICDYNNAIETFTRIATDPTYEYKFA